MKLYDMSFLLGQIIIFWLKIMIKEQKLLNFKIDGIIL